VPVPWGEDEVVFAENGALASAEFSNLVNAPDNTSEAVAVPNTLAFLWQKINRDQRFNIKILGPSESFFMASVVGFISLYLRVGGTPDLWVIVIVVASSSILGIIWGQLHKVGSYVYDDGQYVVTNGSNPYVRKSANNKSIIGAVWLGLYALVLISGVIPLTPFLGDFTPEFISFNQRFVVTMALGTIAYILHASLNMQRLSIEDRPPSIVGTYDNNRTDAPIFFGNKVLAFGADAKTIAVSPHGQPGYRRLYDFDGNSDAVSMDSTEKYLAGLNKTTGKLSLWDADNQTSPLLPTFGREPNLYLILFPYG